MNENEFVFGVYGVSVYGDLFPKATIIAAAEHAKANGLIADYRIEEKTPGIGTVYATVPATTSKGE